MNDDRSERTVRALLYLIATAYGLTFWYHPAHDPDLGWHLLGGAWIVQHHAVPDADFINTFNPFWHDYHWLAQIGLYDLYQLGSYELLRFALGVLMAGLGIVLMRIILRCAPRPLPIVPIVLSYLGAMTLVGAVTSVRPQMLSVLCLALALQRLLDPPRPRELVQLFALAVLAVNIHVYWVFIPFLWLLYRCVPRITGETGVGAAHAWGGLALLSAAGLVSPYGVLHAGSTTLADVLMNYAVVWDYLLTPAVLKETIFELRSGLAAEGVTPFLLVAYVALFARSLQRRRAADDLPNTLAFAVAGILPLMSLKYVAVFGVLGLPYIARYVVADVAAILPSRRAVETPLLTVVLAASVAHAAWYFPWTAPNNEYIYEWCPIEACRFIAHMDLHARPPRDHIRVATHFNNGGWCRWVLYQERPEADFRVTTDGRTQAVPAQRIIDSFNLYQMKGDALATLAQWSPDVILVHKSSALVNFLRIAPDDYALEFQDDHFAVFRPLH